MLSSRVFTVNNHCAICHKVDIGIVFFVEIVYTLREEIEMKNTKREFHTHEFGPFFRPDSIILILGSFPSVKSREAAFFYGHPQNRFWKVMSMICGDALPVTRAEKEIFLSKNKIALYDVIESCSIIGSSDSSISEVTPANLKPVLAGSNVGNNIFTNGKTAYRLYLKYLEPEYGIIPALLPSSSPANAAWHLPELEEAWAAAFARAGFPSDSRHF